MVSGKVLVSHPRKDLDSKHGEQGVLVAGFQIPSWEDREVQSMLGRNNDGNERAMDMRDSPSVMSSCGLRVLILGSR